MNAIIYNNNAALNHAICADANALFSEGEKNLGKATLVNHALLNSTVSASMVIPVVSSYKSLPTFTNHSTSINIQSSTSGATKFITSTKSYDFTSDIILHNITSTNRYDAAPIICVSKSSINYWLFAKIITTNIYYLELKKA